MENCFKVTLPSGKVVLLREMKVRFEDLALKSVGNKAGKNEMYSQKLVGDEMLKLLLISVDGKKPAPLELENIDEMFAYRDIIALRKVVHKITGAEEGETQALDIEMVKSESGA